MCAKLGAIMGEDYPEDLLPGNVIVPLSEGTGTPTEGEDTGSDLPPRWDGYRGATGLSDHLNSPLECQRAIYEELTAIRALLTELRDLGSSIKLPSWLRSKHG